MPPKDDDDRTLAPLTAEQLAVLLTNVDTALAEGRALREKIVSAMRERTKNPIWPQIERRKKPRNAS